MKTEFDVNISEKNMFVFLFNNTYRRMTGIIWIIFSIVIIGVTVYTWGDVKIQNSILMILLASLYTVITRLCYIPEPGNRSGIMIILRMCCIMSLTKKA